MKKSKLYIPILIVIWICLPVGEAIAQAGGFTGSFSRMGFAPRGMAMGNSLTAVHQEGSYGYYNPALAAKPSEHIQLDFSSSAMRFDRQLHMVSAHFQLPPSAGISVALLNGRMGEIDGRSQSGFATETFSTNEYQLLSNFGIRFSETFWGGIGIKFNLADYHTDVTTSTSVGVDAGFFKQAGRVGIGVAVQDLFASTQYDTSNLFGANVGGSRSNSYPTRIKFGTSYTPAELPDLLVSADYEIQVLRSEVRRESIQMSEGRPLTTTTREEVTTNSQFIRIGSRYTFHPRFTLRAGLQALDLNHDLKLQPTTGFSLHLPFDRFTPSIDYAFVREPSQISTMHVFSIRLQL
ncbi:PorV/PorQ family protein [soil metagenome]